MPRCYPASLSSGGRPETIPFHAGHRFRANPKKCPTCRRNGCPTSSGTGVQHVPEWVSSMVRNTHPVGHEDPPLDVILLFQSFEDGRKGLPFRGIPRKQLIADRKPLPI